MKKLAGHQTYFFPYIGFFTVLNSVDIFIYADALQYVKQSWMNRNRIIGEDGNIKYLIVPLKKHHRDTPTNQIEVSYNRDWENEMINQLGYYKKKAPYYAEVVDMLRELFSKKYEMLADLDMASVDMVLERLGIQKRIHKLSDFTYPDPKTIATDEWGIQMCKFFSDEGIDTYTNAPGGKAFYDPAKYEKNGLNIEFLQNNLRPYDQGLDHFIDSLSIIDVLMFNTPEEIREMINDYHVL